VRPLILVSLLLCPFLNASTLPPEGDQRLAREIYQEMIEVKSGFTTGSTTPIAEAVAKRLMAAGFPEADVFVGGAIERKANVVVRYHGTGGRKPILLLAHTDVVEAKREDWSLEPFQLTEKDGYFYGRGTGDDKAQAAIWIANLIRYKREGFKPDRDIIVALTADEEGGGPYSGITWLLKNHRNLIDAEFCLNEGGRGESEHGKRVANEVQASEKTYADFRLEVHNQGGHSSLPVPENAIYRLATALERLAKFNFPLKTNEVTKAYFTQIAKIEKGPMAADLAKAAGGARDAMDRIARANPSWNSMLRTTCVATQLEGGHAKNALPQLAAANINCRILPEDSIQYVENTLRQVIADAQVSIKADPDISAAPSPLRPELIKAIDRVDDSLWPGLPTVPVMSTGATDGRFLRESGIPTYGVQGIFVDRDDVRSHGRDERIRVQSFYEGQTFLYELVKALASPAK
jgi:acetylornithine deacetylase/succinyl-diaminopimelate desuccinylase-like protein